MKSLNRAALLLGARLLSAHGALQPCPGSYTDSIEIDAQATLQYAMVPSEPGAQNGVFCGRLEVADHTGYVALGVAASKTAPFMNGADAIIGVPADGSVLKYDLTFQATLMGEDKQTLEETSVVEEDGRVVMTFAKLCTEEGENPILPDGANVFLHARGGDTVGYHTFRTNFDADFSDDSASAAIEVGEQVCITGYIMDNFCIDRGTLLDNRDVTTLKNPEEHSFHCLLDVGLCVNSGFQVLGEKNPDTGLHCPGFRLDDTEKVLAAGQAVGKKGYCTTCTDADATKPEYGYRATIKGTVKELGDDSSVSAGAPLLTNIEVLDESVGCDGNPTIPPLCMATDEQEPAEETPPAPVPEPVPEPVPAAPAEPVGPAKDCTKELCDSQQSDEYLLRYQINVPDDTTVDVCDACTITMELIYSGEAWVAIGFSTDGLMTGSEAVIGVPSDSTVQKYNLNEGRAVVPMPKSQQTLTDTSIEVVDGETIVKFTKIMKEAGEIEITTGDNTFLWAYGTGTTLGFHADRSPFALNLSSGASEEVAVANKSVWLAHGIMAFCAWGVFVPFAVQSSLLRQFLPAGPLWFKLHRGFNSVAFLFFIIIFVIAVVVTSQEGGSHFDNAHQTMGLAMFIMATIQVAGGVFRPHTPEEGEEKTSVRAGWEVIHRVLGVTLLACGFWQMREGIELFAGKYSLNDGGIGIAYWVWIGIMSALIVAGIGLKLMKSNSGN